VRDTEDPSPEHALVVGQAILHELEVWDQVHVERDDPGAIESFPEENETRASGQWACAAAMVSGSVA
jgi:hypothetical protein